MLVVALAFALLATTTGKLLTTDDGDLGVELHSALAFESTDTLK
jgi:hypothetical protein